MVAAEVRGIEVLLAVIIGDDLVTAVLDDANMLAQRGEAERAAA